MCCMYTTVLTQPPKTIENENCVHTAVCTQFSMVLGGFVNTAVYTQTMFAIQLLCIYVALFSISKTKMSTWIKS